MVTSDGRSRYARAPDPDGWAADADPDLFTRNPQGSGRYVGRLLGRALCKGAALHYVNKRNGVKDLSFYAQYDDWPFLPINLAGMQRHPQPDPFLLRMGSILADQRLREVLPTVCHFPDEQSCTTHPSTVHQIRRAAALAHAEVRIATG